MLRSHEPARAIGTGCPFPPPRELTVYTVGHKHSHSSVGLGSSLAGIGIQHHSRARLSDTRSFIYIVVGSILVQLLLLPLSHTWDGQTWVNAFAELTAPGNLIEALRRPYDVTRELSLLTQAAGHQSDFYESWAYPPFMLYVYWPLAHLYVLLRGPLQATFPVQPAFFSSSTPLLLLAFIRLPVILAQAGIAVLMRMLGLAPNQIRWYLFNPMVLLAGVWTFDAVMVLFVLLTLALAERGQWAGAGVAIALGAATKFVPVVLVPALAVAILSRPTSMAERLRALAAMLAGTILALAALIGPVFAGVKYIVQAQTARFAAGLTFQQLWRAWAQQLPAVDWQPRWQIYASDIAGNLILPMALILATLVILQVPQLSASALIMVLAFLAGSKLVNEAYVVAPLALCTVELARRPSAVLRDCRTLLWVLAFAYAAINTPIWGFFFSFAQQINPAWAGPILHRTDAYRVFLSDPLAVWPYALMGVGFSLTAVLMIALAARGAWASRASLGPMDAEIRLVAEAGA